jgi:hypothetical protein
MWSVGTGSSGSAVGLKACVQSQTAATLPHLSSLAPTSAAAAAQLPLQRGGAYTYSAQRWFERKVAGPSVSSLVGVAEPADKRTVPYWQGGGSANQPAKASKRLQADEGRSGPFKKARAERKQGRLSMAEELARKGANKAKRAAVKKASPAGPAAAVVLAKRQLQAKQSRSAYHAAAAAAKRVGEATTGAYLAMQADVLASLGGCVWPGGNAPLPTALHIECNSKPGVLETCNPLKVWWVGEMGSNKMAALRQGSPADFAEAACQGTSECWSTSLKTPVAGVLQPLAVVLNAIP